MPKRTLPHIAALDGFRGVAIVLVLWYHCGTVFGGPARSHGWLSSCQSMGFTGVDLFFVLSGFLITCILLNTRERKGYLMSFYSRRGLRIYPLYFALLTLICLVLTPLFLKTRIEHYAIWREGWPWNWVFLTNFYVAMKGHWVANITDVSWSVCIEEQFYLVWPLILLLLPTRRMIRWFLLSAIVASILCRWYVVTHYAAYQLMAYVLPFCRMDAIAVGALVAVYWTQGEEEVEHKSRPYLATAAVAMAVVLVGIAGSVRMTRVGVTFSYTGYAAAYGALLVALLYTGRTWLTRMMECRPLQYLGTISYGLYLWHLLIADTLKNEMLNRFENPMIGYLVTSVAMVAGALVVATLSWRLYEKPMLNLKRFVPRPSRGEYTSSLVPKVEPKHASADPMSGVGREGKSTCQ